MKNVPLAAILSLTVACTACGDFGKTSSPEKAQEAQCTTRFTPVGNDPEIALDTQSGELCRTVADTGDPLGILDPACGVSEDMKKVGFVPRACNSGKTWVKGEGDKHPSRYSNLPRCGKVIVVTPEDMKSAK